MCWTKTNILTIILAIWLNYTLVCGEKVKVVELSSGWHLRNQNGSIDLPVAKIPSGVFSALSELYGDVLHSFNDEHLRWISLDNWTYTNVFNVQIVDFLQVRSINLTLHCVDTVAKVRLNNVLIGQTNNMFVRYSYEVKQHLLEQNVLEIEIQSPIYAAMEQARLLNGTNATEPYPTCISNERQFGACHRNLLRKMQLSFGGRSFPIIPSMGIWKPITLEYLDVAIMRDIDVATYKNDTHWILDIRAHLSTDLQQDFYGQLTLIAPDLLEEPIKINRSLISFQQPLLKFKHAVPISQVIQWWPNGYGVQKLYPLHFKMNCWLENEHPQLRAKTTSSKSLNIGFRTIELVEEVVETGRTFFFKINGVEIFMKGAIYMPAHLLPELSADEDKVHHIMKSAKEAHMNMLRVWGGGLYESDYFYKMADYYGLLIWQDMAFTAATYPVNKDFVESVRVEARQNAKRLAHHPSLAIFVTNDEIELVLSKNYNSLKNYQNYTLEYKELFVSVLQQELSIITRNVSAISRPKPLISTPSNGRTGMAKNITANPQDPNFGDVHVRDVFNLSWLPTSYPRPRFVSAYGFPSLPTMSAWNQTVSVNDDITEVIKHRQHLIDDFTPIKDFIDSYAPLLDPKADNYIDTLIYFSQIAQAMAAKVATEVFRSQRNTEHKTMGALYWQLNDVWVAPTSSILDFYGNYKILYYWLKHFLAPTAIIALYDDFNQAINVTVVRDEINVDPEIYDVTMNMYLWSDLFPKKNITWQAILRQNETQLKQLELNQLFTKRFNINNCFFEFILSASSRLISRTFHFPGTLSEATGISDPELSFYISWKYCNVDYKFDRKIISYSLTITIKKPALFVYIEVNNPEVKNYKLSHNGFMQVEPVKIVHLEFAQKSDCITIGREHIKVIAANQFMVPSKTVDNATAPTDYFTDVDPTDSDILYANATLMSADYI